MLRKPQEEAPKQPGNRVTLPEESGIRPLAGFKEFIAMAEASKGSQFELSWTTKVPGQRFVLDMQWEAKQKAPFWTLYEETNGKSKRLWNEPLTIANVDMCYDILVMTCGGVDATTKNLAEILKTPPGQEGSAKPGNATSSKLPSAAGQGNDTAKSVVSNYAATEDKLNGTNADPNAFPPYMYPPSMGVPVNPAFQTLPNPPLSAPIYPPNMPPNMPPNIQAMPAWQYGVPAAGTHIYGQPNMPIPPMSNVPMPGIPMPNVPVPNIPVPNIPVPMQGVPVQNVPGVPMPGVPVQNVPGVPMQGMPINEPLQNAQLQNAQLQNAQLQNAQLQNAQLQNAQVQNAQVQNPQLQNASVMPDLQPTIDPTAGSLASLPVDNALFKKENDVSLVDLIVKAELITETTLAAALKIRELIQAQQLTWERAVDILKHQYNKGDNIESYISVSTPVTPKSSSAKGQKKEVASSEEDLAAFALLQQSGLISQDDINTAKGVVKKHGGDMTAVLTAAQKLDERTLAAAKTCSKLEKDGLIKVEQSVIIVNYCSRSRVSFDEALEELGWPDPRKEVTI